MATVLVIDDDPVIRTGIELALKHRGHEVLIAADGDQAIDIFSAQQSDAVVCDLFMPNREGIETIQQLRRRNARLFVVAVSGGLVLPKSGARIDYLAAARTFGADISFTKPFRFSDLVTAIETGLQGGPAAGAH